MSIAYDLPRQEPRPRLRIVHSQPLPDEEPAQAPSASLQQELPLRWPNESQEAVVGLGRYPAIKLLPEIPRPEPYVAHIATLLADILSGTRSATQLSRWATLDVQQRLARRAVLRGSRSQSAPAARVCSTSTMVVSESTAQVVVVFRAGPRAHAAAVRIEYRHRRWQVTDVQTPA